MDTSLEELKTIVLGIVDEARRLKDYRTDQILAPVNYACVFSQTQDEYESFLRTARSIGKFELAQETKAGPVFKIPPLPTSAGELNLLKIRAPDPARIERGDADFTVSDYPAFKARHLNQTGFGLIKREKFEMIELIEPGFRALAYFSHPTLGEVLGISR